MTMSAPNRGVIAAVTDRASRDVEEIEKIRFPVICKGVVPYVGAVAGYGDANASIQCAVVAVSSGDIMAVDGNAVSAKQLVPAIWRPPLHKFLRCILILLQHNQPRGGHPVNDYVGFNG